MGISISYIEVLPDDMLTSIFEFLKPEEIIGITRVCKKWLSLVRNNVRLYKRFVSTSLPKEAARLNLLKELKIKYELPRFTPNPSYFEISKNGKMVKRISRAGRYRGIFCSQFEMKPGSKISFKINSFWLFIGLAPKQVDQSLHTHYQQPGGGWYLPCFEGTLYCRDLKFYGKSYHDQHIPDNSIISLELSESGDIVFYLNGYSLGVAFSNVNQPVIPAVLLIEKNDFVEIVENPK